MKAVLKFDMSDEEDKYNFDVIYNARKYKSILWELNSYLRDEIKYNNLPKDKEKIYQEIRDYLNDLCLEENIDLY